MHTLTIRKIIGIQIFMLFGIVIFFPEGLVLDSESLHLYAICLAAFLPAACLQLSRLNLTLTLPLALVASVSLGGLWYYIIKMIYPSSAILLGAVVFLGSYLMLRIQQGK